MGYSKGNRVRNKTNNSAHDNRLTGKNVQWVQAQLRQAFERWGLPGGLCVDNGKPWGSWSDLPTALALWLLGLGIALHWNPPRRPWKNGVVEHSQETAPGSCKGSWTKPTGCSGSCTRSWARSLVRRGPRDRTFWPHFPPRPGKMR
jgi:hypothetical protein